MLGEKGEFVGCSDSVSEFFSVSELESFSVSSSMSTFIVLGGGRERVGLSGLWRF